MVDGFTCAESAIKKIRYAIGERQFPQNVYTDEWESFLFFDSDRVFAPEFITIIKRLINKEGSACACILNLNISPNSHIERPYFFVDSTQCDEDYRVFRMGNHVSQWLTKLGRFGCASDIGNWCIYCEGQAEIAVIATRRGWPINNLDGAIDDLAASSIQDAIGQSHIYGLSPHSLSEEWRSRLIQEYKTK